MTRTESVSKRGSLGSGTGAVGFPTRICVVGGIVAESLERCDPVRHFIAQEGADFGGRLRLRRISGIGPKIVTGETVVEARELPDLFAQAVALALGREER